eukprot:SAG11_NODE_267_length_11457_cov_14.773728_1_plen_900_part_00
MDADETLDLDQIVWAKAKGFDWWPAQIFEERDSSLVPEGHIPVRFLDDNSWTYVLPRAIADFVADYEQIYELGMPSDERMKRKFDRAVVAGRQLTAMVGWVQCENCNKWRRYPCVILSLRDDWVCSMNTWDMYSSCSIPEQLTEQENSSEPQTKKQRAAAQGGGSPTLHRAEDKDVWYMDFTTDRKFKGRVHIVLKTNPRLVYVRDLFGVVWKTDDTRRLNDKYKNHKSKFEHILRHHSLGAGKTKAVISVDDLQEVLNCFKEEAPKAFVACGDLQKLVGMVVEAEEDGSVAELDSEEQENEDEEDEEPDPFESASTDANSPWNVVEYCSRDRKFSAKVRLSAGLASIALPDFISCVCRLPIKDVSRLTFSVRTRLEVTTDTTEGGSTIGVSIIEGVPVVKASELQLVLKQLPTHIVRQYRETGDERAFRNVFTQRSTWSNGADRRLMRGEMETSIGSNGAAKTATTPTRAHSPGGASPRSRERLAASAAQWIGKVVRLSKGGDGDGGGRIARVESAANGYYLVRIQAQLQGSMERLEGAGTSACAPSSKGLALKVRAADMSLVDMNTAAVSAAAAAAAPLQHSAEAASQRGMAGSGGRSLPKAGRVPRSKARRGSMGGGGGGGGDDEDDEDNAASEELMYEATEEQGWPRGMTGLRVKWTRPPHLSAADLVCLIAGVETRREASVVVSELRDKLLAAEALGYCSIKGYPKRIPCLKFAQIEKFLELLPSHYMVSDAAIQRFRASANERGGPYHWLHEQLGESGLLTSPDALTIPPGHAEAYLRLASGSSVAPSCFPTATDCGATPTSVPLTGKDSAGTPTSVPLTGKDSAETPTSVPLATESTGKDSAGVDSTGVDNAEASSKGAEAQATQSNVECAKPATPNGNTPAAAGAWVAEST